MINSQSGAPANYAELYESYFGMMKSIVRRAGINAGDVEDVAAEILCKFMEKDALSWYDPNHVTDVGEHPKTEGPRLRQPRFSNLLRTFTQLYVRQWLDKQRLLERREPAYSRMDAPVSSEESMTWGEAHQDTYWQGHPMDVSVEDQLMMVTVISGAHGRALRKAQEAQDATDQQVFWKMRLEAKRAAEEATRQHQGLLAAMRLAGSGELVTGVALARECGWSSQVGARVLRGVRNDLRVAGF